MGANKELRTATADYAKTRAVFNGYKKVKYSKKYLVEHEADIEVYRTAQATFRRVLNGEKLPKMDALKTEAQELAADKKKAYREYQSTRKDRNMFL